MGRRIQSTQEPLTRPHCPTVPSISDEMMQGVITELSTVRSPQAKALDACRQSRCKNPKVRLAGWRPERPLRKRTRSENQPFTTVKNRWQRFSQMDLPAAFLLHAAAARQHQDDGNAGRRFERASGSSEQLPLPLLRFGAEVRHEFRKTRRRHLS